MATKVRDVPLLLVVVLMHCLPAYAAEHGLFEVYNTDKNAFEPMAPETEGAAEASVR